MAFCGTCGAPVEGRFCAKCGSPVAAAAPPPVGAAMPPGAGMPPPPAPGVPPVGGYSAPPPAAAPMADNVACTLCYVLGFVTGIIFLVLAPYNQNRTVRFHAFQAIFMSLSLLVIRIVLGMVLGALLFSSSLGLLAIYGLFWTLYGLACLILWIYMLVQTYQGKHVVLPIVGPLAQKQA